MKKLIVTSLAIALASTLAQAQTNQVLSRNAVGYVKVAASSNKMYQIRNDFEGLDGGYLRITNMIGDQVPVGSSISLWNKSGQTYIGGTRTKSTGWGTFGTNVVRRGESIFLKVPSGVGISNYNVYIMGEVPDVVTAPTTIVANVTALGMYGYPYPVAMKWTNMNISKNGAVGDSLSIWSSTGQTYQGWTRTKSSGWGAATNVILQPGEGFWFKSAVTQQWTEVKPYTWP